jgi:hypothetical protein
VTRRSSVAGSAAGPGFRRSAARRPVGPELAAFFDRQADLPPRLAGGGGVARGPGRALPDPGLQIGDLFVREAFLRGHLEVVVDPADRFQEQAFLRISRDERRPGVAPFQGAFAGIEVQTALEFFRLRAMAGIASLGQQRTDLFLEELEILGPPGFLSMDGAQKEPQHPSSQDQWTEILAAHFRVRSPLSTPSLAAAFFGRRIAKPRSRAALERFRSPRAEPPVVGTSRTVAAPSMRPGSTRAPGVGEGCGRATRGVFMRTSLRRAGWNG